jgi:GTP-binding protein
MAFISAKEEQNITELIRLAQVLFEQANTRLQTSQLNKAVEEILALRGPSSPTAQKVKVYYATQIDTNPPTLVLFVNNPDLITEEYRRFFIRQLRERLPFSEVPVRLHVRGHHRSFERAAKEHQPERPGAATRARPKTARRPSTAKKSRRPARNHGPRQR